MRKLFVCVSRSYRPVFGNSEPFLFVMLAEFAVFLPVDLWEFYLPYLYSCISLMGGLLLLCKSQLIIILLLLSRLTLWKRTNHICFLCTRVVCTPVGLSRMFTVMGQLLVKPTVRVLPLRWQIIDWRFTVQFRLERSLQRPAIHIHNRGLQIHHRLTLPSAIIRSYFGLNYNPFHLFLLCTFSFRSWRTWMSKFTASICRRKPFRGD